MDRPVDHGASEVRCGASHRGCGWAHAVSGGRTRRRGPAGRARWRKVGGRRSLSGARRRRQLSSSRPPTATMTMPAINRQVGGGAGEGQPATRRQLPALTAGSGSGTLSDSDLPVATMFTADSPATTGGSGWWASTTGVLSDTSTSVVTSMSQSTAWRTTVQVPVPASVGMITVVDHVPSGGHRAPGPRGRRSQRSRTAALSRSVSLPAGGGRNSTWMDVPGVPVPVTVSVSPGWRPWRADRHVARGVVLTVVIDRGGGGRRRGAGRRGGGGRTAAPPLQRRSGVEREQEWSVERTGGEIMGGVAPVMTSNCTGSHVLVKMTSVVPGSRRVNGSVSRRRCGHATPLPGIW